MAFNFKTPAELASEVHDIAIGHQTLYNHQHVGISALAQQAEEVSKQVGKLVYYYPEEVVETREEMEAMEFYTPFMVRFPNGAQILLQRARGNTWFSTWEGETDLDKVWDLIHKGGARVFALPCPPREVDLSEDVEPESD